jgi:hypothetical protein
VALIPPSPFGPRDLHVEIDGAHNAGAEFLFNEDFHVVTGTAQLWNRRQRILRFCFLRPLHFQQCLRAIACKAQRQARHPLQCRIRNLQLLLTPRWFESLTLRHK